MTPGKDTWLPPDFDELRERIQKDRQELEQAGAELKALGKSLKKEHIRRMLEPGSLPLAGREEEAAPVNELCRQCLRSCKQTVRVKIFRCNKFERI